MRDNFLDLAGMKGRLTDEREIPKITIGMPVYNGESFISEALESLLAQTYTNYELIISDNASTDQTEVICKGYAIKDARIRYVRQHRNGGSLMNFKFVLDKATTEYFMWAAADDVWEKNWIESLLPLAMMKNQSAFGVVQSIDERGNCIFHPVNGRNLGFNGGVIRRRVQYFLLPGFLGKANPIYAIHPLRTLRQLDINILNYSDMLYMYNLLQINSIVINDNTIIFKRIHDQSVGAALIRSKTSQYRVFQFILFLPRMIYISISDLYNYGLYSSKCEKSILTMLTPIYFLRLVFWAIKFRLDRIKYKFK